MTPDQWRAFRLVRGTYGQRQADDAQMLRVKIPQGMLTADQLDALADVGERYSRGFGHITTRQNIQFHFVKLHDVEPAMRRLADAGLTTREACGNSVRNITACPYAGVAADERFDVTPYAEALTRYPAAPSAQLDAAAQVQDRLRRLPDGSRRDRRSTTSASARCSGPTAGAASASRRAAARRSCASRPALLHEFLPASEIFRVAEAVLRVFQRLGDYQHKQRNRMKFMIKTLGWTRWREEYERELTALPAERRGADARDRSAGDRVEAGLGRRTRRRRPGISRRAWRRSTITGPGITPTIVPVLQAGDEAYARWRATNVQPQKQFGYRDGDRRRVPLGDLTSEQMRVLGELARAYGDGTVRVTPDQDLVFRWVNACDVRQLYRRLAAAGLGLAEAGTVADVASCPGAESCRLAVTQSRGLGRLLEDHLRARPDLDRRGRRRAHQDQRLPERLRPASHRDDRVPGQRAAGRRRAPCRSTS